MRSPTSRTCAMSYKKLMEDLESRGRADWMGEEMNILTSPSTYRQDPRPPTSG